MICFNSSFFSPTFISRSPILFIKLVLLASNFLISSRAWSRRSYAYLSFDLSTKTCWSLFWISYLYFYNYSSKWMYLYASSFTYIDFVDNSEFNSSVDSFSLRICSSAVSSYFLYSILLFYKILLLLSKFCLSFKT